MSDKRNRLGRETDIMGIASDENTAQLENCRNSEICILARHEMGFDREA